MSKMKSKECQNVEFKTSWNDNIEVEIEPSNVPISYKGKYYYRSGSTMQELRSLDLDRNYHG